MFGKRHSKVAAITRSTLTLILLGTLVSLLAIWGFSNYYQQLPSGNPNGLYTSTSPQMCSFTTNIAILTGSPTNDSSNSLEVTGDLASFKVGCISIWHKSINAINESYVYLALNNTQQAQGFQNVEGFGDCNGRASVFLKCIGMMFVFSTTENLCFWMHDTRIPLLQAWISKNGTVTSLYEAAPESDQSTCHSGMFVLETFPNASLSVGDLIQQLY